MPLQGSALNAIHHIQHSALLVSIWQQGGFGVYDIETGRLAHSKLGHICDITDLSSILTQPNLLATSSRDGCGQHYCADWASDWYYVHS